MSFLEIFQERVKDRPLIAFTLDADNIHGLLEEICMRLDKINQQVQNLDESVQGKASFNEMSDFKDDVKAKMDQVDMQLKHFDDKINGIDTMCKERLNKMDEEMEKQIGNCLVEAGALVRQQIEQVEPELTKKVIEAMPSVDGLMKHLVDSKNALESVNKKIDSFQDQMQQLANKDQDLQDQINALPQVPQSPERVTVRSARNSPKTSSRAEKADSQQQQQPTQEAGAPPSVLEPVAFPPPSDALLQDDIAKVKEDLMKLIKQQDAKIKEIDDNVESAREYTTQQVNDARNELSSANRNLDNQLRELQHQLQDLSNRPEKKSARAPEIPPDLIEKINGIEKQLTDINGRVMQQDYDNQDIQNSLKALKEALEKPTQQIDKDAIIDKETGEIDLSPILNSINHFDGQMKILQSRIDVLEQRKQISPEALASTREIVSKSVDRINALEARLTEAIADVNSKMDHDLFSLREELLNECRDIRDVAQNAKDASAASTRTGEETMRLLQKTRSELSDLAMKVTELGEISQNDNKIEKLSSAIASLSLSFNAHANDTKNYADMFDELMKCHAQDKSEITELWMKFNELSKQWNDKSESFIPSKIELVNPRQKTIVVSRSLEKGQDDSTPRKSSILPRISARAVIDDSKLDSTNAKVEKQENVLASIKRQVDQHTKLLQQLEDSKADKISAQSLFEQFRIAMGELNNRLLTLKRNLLGKADVAEVHKLLQQSYESNDTAGAYEPVRCICCGRPRTGVVGALDESSVKRPPPLSSRVISDADGQVCFVYGENGDMYIGRSPDGRSRFTTKPQEDATPPPSIRKP